MADIPQELVDELAPAVAAVLPALAARVPAPPAARLGRLGAARGITALVAPRDHVFPMPGPFPPGATAADLGPGMWHGGPPVALELQRLPQLLTQRLLGALELNVPAIRVPAAGRLVTASITGNYGIMHTSGEAETASAVRLLDTLHPGTPEIVTALVARLAAHPEAAAALAVPPGVAGEDGIAAEHGARHLALAVAAAGAVLDAAEVLDPRTQRPVAVVGLGIGTAALLLREVPMPPGYLEAAFAAARTDYLMPRQTGGSVPVADHRFAVAEGDPEAFDAAPVRTAGFDRNGLVTEIEGGLVVRTGLAEGQVRVGVEVRDAAPRRVAAWAEEAVELTWRAGLGAGSVIGPDAPGDGHLLGVTPPWPGDFRVRVYAAGRDEAADDLAAGRPGESECYELLV